MQRDETTLLRAVGFAPALVEAARRATVGVVVGVLSDGGFRCEFANERVLTLIGRAPKRVPADLGFDERAARRVAEWLGSTEAGQLVLESVELVGAPAPGPVRVVASRTTTGGETTVVFFLFDAVVRRLAERALAESEARFRRLLDSAPDAVVLGTRQRFVYANPAAVRLLGYASMEEVTRVPVREHIYPEDRFLSHAVVASLRASDRPLRPTRIRVVRKDGGVVHLELQPIAIEWDDEPAMLGIGRDLTERRRAQAQAIRADRLSAMGTLAAGVAHEINNPLAYLMLNLQYLMRELPRFDGSSDRLAVLLERLGEAEHGARRVSTIVGDLRTLARPEQTEQGPVSVGAAAAAALKVVGAELKRRARIVEEYAEAPLVHASTTRLEQVFVNLLVNAGHAIAEGSVDRNEVRVRVYPQGDHVVAEVRDTGAGIPPAILGRVFDPFFTTKPRGTGTGLGLPISRGIVKSLGGEITVESVLGSGTTFRVSLPALPNAEAPGPAPKEEPAPSAVSHPRPPRIRVLVVDDEPLVADMLQRTLSDHHDVTVATDAQTALEHVLSGSAFDLIFCDLLMPRMTGMDLYDELKARRPGVEQRIVFMTGGAFTERAAQFLSKVTNRKLSKPFDLEELERVVSRAARARA